MILLILIFGGVRRLGCVGSLILVIGRRFCYGGIRRRRRLGGDWLVLFQWTLLFELLWFLSRVLPGRIHRLSQR
jgi:hypothetical protein